MTADEPAGAAAEPMSPDERTRSPGVSHRVVYVTAGTDDSGNQGCRSFCCPRVAEVVVKFDDEITDAAGPSPDWFWCLGHWPALRGMLYDRGHRIEYSAEALALVSGVVPEGHR